MTKMTLNEFIKKAKLVHSDKYNYSLVNYINNHTKVKIICEKHGTFLQNPNSHINRKDGCPNCRVNKKIDKDEFIKRAKKVHKNKYDYGNIDYINSRTKISIICKKHGVFKQTPNNHLRNHGCPKCNRSKGEIIIENYLIENNMLYETEYKFDNLRYKYPLSFDFIVFDNNKNIKNLIEFNGKQHYRYFKAFHNSQRDYEEGLERDKLKIEYCIDNNIKLLIIKHTDDIIEKLIKYYGENK